MGAGSDEMARLWMMDGLVVWLVRQRRHEQRGEEANARWKSLPRTSRGAAAARERHLPLNLNHNHSTTHHELLLLAAAAVLLDTVASQLSLPTTPIQALSSPRLSPRI